MAEPAEEHEELVKVFDTDEESEAMVVRGLLESAGIEAIIQNREAPQDILPGVGGVVVLVRPTRPRKPSRPSKSIAIIPPPTRTRRSARNRSSGNVLPVQVKRDSSGQIGAIGLDLRLGVTLHHLRPGMLERVVEPDRHHRKARLHRRQKLRRTRGRAAMMPNLQQVGLRALVDQKLFDARCESPTSSAEVSP